MSCLLYTYVCGTLSVELFVCVWVRVNVFSFHLAVLCIFVYIVLKLYLSAPG